jgi:hypothetical protein
MRWNGRDWALPICDVTVGSLKNLYKKESIQKS